MNACKFCRGEGAIDEMVQYWPIYSTDEEPVLRFESRIICPRCDGEGHEPQTDDHNDDPTARRERLAADLAR